MHMLCKACKGAALYDKLRHIRLSKRSVKLRVRFYGIDVESLLALDTLAQQSSVMKSSIPHPDFGLGKFAAPKIGEQ